MIEIKFQWFSRVFSLCIGRKTDWFEQLDFVTFIEEFYYNREVQHATFIFGLFRKGENHEKDY